MKIQINDLLLKMQTGENCIGETANHLLNLLVVGSTLTEKEKLFINTLLINKLLEKEDNGTYKAGNDISIMDKINTIMEKIQSS